MLIVIYNLMTKKITSKHVTVKGLGSIISDSVLAYAIPLIHNKQVLDIQITTETKKIFIVKE